jgi:hypothetical protein
MTTFETRFELGQKAWTVDTDELRIVEFEIGKIQIQCTKAGVQVFLHPMKDGSPVYSGYRENVCYTSRQELMAHLDNETETESK